jgi:hypothetical protein
MLVLASTQKRLVDLERLQRERCVGAMVDEFGRLVQQTPDRERAILTITFYWLCHEPGGPTERDLDAMLRLLRRQSLPRRYRLLVERAEAELDAAERGEARPVFLHLWQWLGIDQEPGHGRAGTGLTW